MNTVMGVDVGGTKILIGIVRPDGTITPVSYTHLTLPMSIVV